MQNKRKHFLYAVHFNAGMDGGHDARLSLPDINQSMSYAQHIALNVCGFEEKGVLYFWSPGFPTLNPDILEFISNSWKSNPDHNMDDDDSVSIIQIQI